MPLNSSDIEESFSTTDEDIKILLSNILNLNLQNKSSEKLVISTINKLLSVSKTRLQGLEFLNLIICNCSKSIVIENALTWISHCLIKYTGDNLKEIKLSTIGKIIQNVYSEHEFGKKFIPDYISKVLESCISTHANSHETEAALQTLTTCMKYYSSWFTAHKEKIETFVITFLDSPSESVVEKAGLTFLYLQQVGGAGIDGVNHRTNFSMNFAKICFSTHKLFDMFFQNEIEIDNGDRSDQDVFSFADPSHYPQKVIHITARRITNCLKFLKIMLLKGFPVAKDIRPMEVLGIISRGTTLHHCLSVDNEKPLNDFQFSLLLNMVQIQLLQLLRIFIIWLQESSLPFSFTISKILIDCLKKIQNCQCFTTNGLYQEILYKVLGSWLRVSRNSFHAHFQTQLVTCILKDITPAKTNITLSLQTDTKNKSAKAKRKLIQDRVISSGQGSTTEKLTPSEKLCDEKKCLFALGALKQLLISTTLKLKRSLLQDLYTTIINSTLEVQASKFNHPYSNTECQEKLYEVFVAFYEQETLKVLPPLQLTISILNKGISNENTHIALTCERGLSIIEKLCQPICPSLFMPDMFVSEKDASKLEALFDKKVLEDLSNQNLNGNEHNDVLENANSLNEDLGTNPVVENIEYEIDVEQEIAEKGNTEVNFEIDKAMSDDEIDVEIEEESNQAESISSKTIKREKSIHILDMKIVKTSANGLESEDIKCTEQHILNNPSKENAANPSNWNESIATEVNILKTEILSNANIELSPSDETVPINDKDETEAEPSSKKIRIEEETTFTKLEVKEELKSSEEIDDMFEEDGAFVDEVKEY